MIQTLDIITFSLFLLISSFQLHSFFGYTSEENVNEPLNNAMQEEFSKQNEWGYVIDLPIQVNEIGLTYTLNPSFAVHSIRSTTPEETLRLYAQIVQDALKRCNSIRILRPFFAEFPLTPNNLGLTLHFRTTENKLVPPPYIGSIFIREDKPEEFVIKSYKNPHTEIEPISGVDPKSRSELKELYTVAVPRKACEIKPEVPTPSFLSKTSSTPTGIAEFEFIKEFCSKHDLHLVKTGKVGNHRSPSLPIEIALRGAQTLHLKEARKLATDCAQGALTMARTDKRFIEYMKERGNNPHWNDPATEALPHHISLRLSFWDENVDRVSSEYIAEIRLINETFFYYSADEGQRLMLVHEEGFDQAIGGK
jgi:hypothetical protein